MKLGGWMRETTDVEEVLAHVLFICEREGVEPIGDLTIEHAAPLVPTVEGVPQYPIVRWELTTA